MMITAASNAKIKQVIRWRDKARERKNDGVYLVEGVKMFQEAPDAEIQELYVSEKALDLMKRNESEEIMNKLRQQDFIPVSEDVMAKMSDTQTPQGILTVMKRKEYGQEICFSTENPLIMVLEDIQDPGNLGTIIRTGEGAGVTAVALSKGCVDIYNPKTIRSTMGSIYRVPFFYVDDICEFAGKLAENGVHTFAAHLSGTDYYDGQNFQNPTAFFVGNEGNGLSDELSGMAEKYIRIPMEGKVESLNAGIAASLLMYEAHRQRRAGSFATA